eukprot:2853608-Amphidinium_carterae.1
MQRWDWWSSAKAILRASEAAEAAAKSTAAKVPDHSRTWKADKPCNCLPGSLFVREHWKWLSSACFCVFSSFFATLSVLARQGVHHYPDKMQWRFPLLAGL